MDRNARSSPSQKPSTIVLKYTHVNHALRAAAKDRRIPSNPIEGIALPRLERRESRMKIPTPERVAKLLDAATPEFAAFLSLLGFAGLRVGEGCSVQVDDIKWLEHKINIVRPTGISGQGGNQHQGPEGWQCSHHPVTGS